MAPDMSFLEMLDSLNEDLLHRELPPVAFEHDCREDISGSCGFLINGVALGGQGGNTVGQLAMRFFSDGDSLTLEPWRARAFPISRDLIVNRSPFDRIIQAGGFISAPTGSAPDANAILVPKEAADTAFDAAASIGYGACVVSMVVALGNEHFGSCTNHGECEAVCPKEIPLEFIGLMNRDLMRAAWQSHREPPVIRGIVQHPFQEDAREHAEVEAVRS